MKLTFFEKDFPIKLILNIRLYFCKHIFSLINFCFEYTLPKKVELFQHFFSVFFYCIIDQLKNVLVEILNLNLFFIKNILLIGHQYNFVHKFFFLSQSSMFVIPQQFIIISGFFKK